MAFSFTPVAMFTTAQLASGNTTIYTAASTANTSAIVQKAVVSNPSGSAVSITIYRIASGGSIGSATTLVPQISVSSGATLIVNELNNLVLAPGDSIIVTPTAGAALNFTMSGITTVNV